MIETSTNEEMYKFLLFMRNDLVSVLLLDGCE